MAGITRIKIIGTTCGRGQQRFTDSEAHYALANTLYRAIFDELGMPLETGIEVKEVSADEHDAGYDKFFGIDVILQFKAGNSSTLQEKYLFTTFDTVTVEYMQDHKNNIHGDWYNLRCSYYFVGYDYNYSKNKPRKTPTFNNWILLDWAQVQLLSAQGKIIWKTNINKNDGAMASFKYVPFESIPDEAIIATPKFLTLPRKELITKIVNAA